ncbi:hypothetical protein, unlikely [Trypanosoma congolense IL3000]|uniref:Uncharacterized protein n=1 Tax=Trypanosoma congolense (strain IL3000) TaxID=1068625 RepID=F9WIV2_TRYCI|nr:hypothetical protein, unlikely [Trypanosoma congolense IL3000]
MIPKVSWFKKKNHIISSHSKILFFHMEVTVVTRESTWCKNRSLIKIFLVIQSKKKPKMVTHIPSRPLGTFFINSRFICCRPYLHGRRFVYFQRRGGFLFRR